MIEEEGNLQSPCVRNCCLNEEDICLGCFRSLAEITQWGEADRQERMRILDVARQRQCEAARRTSQG